jgi:hypothetical protein
MFDFFRKSMTVDQVSRELFLGWSRDTKQEWIQRLSQIEGLDIQRAFDELQYLDFFAVYFSLKFNRSRGWSEKGALVYEQIYTLFVSWLSAQWEAADRGTLDDVIGAIQQRIKIYSDVIDSTADPEGNHAVLDSIGRAYVRLCVAEGEPVNGTPRVDKLSEIGWKMFYARGRMLRDYFDTHRLK